MHESEMCGSKEAWETCWSSKLLHNFGRRREGLERKLGTVGQREVGIGLTIGRVDGWTESTYHNNEIGHGSHILPNRVYFSSMATDCFSQSGLW
ncbi:hypothetical protein PBY51_003447 [Eleginops maclovinus]|uniref:Uncharacterized protein n=1 Tax=Eleginops maclovinus TaxID=56733 RepID=A0AAN7Y2D3_ELEMC|nr:hypothetical protein PBY51_003447 [Eleginops maclovinus]